MRPRLTHRSVAVGSGENARGLVEPGTAGAAVVPGAVEPFVMRAGEDADRRERRRLGERALGEVRMEPHTLPLPETERTGFFPDRIRHTHTAEVVRKRGTTEERHGRGREVQAPGGGLCEVGDAGRVLAQPR